MAVKLKRGPPIPAPQAGAEERDGGDDEGPKCQQVHCLCASHHALEAATQAGKDTRRWQGAHDCMGKIMMHPLARKGVKNTSP